MRKNLFKLSMLAVAALTAVRCETLNIGQPTQPSGPGDVQTVQISPSAVEVQVGRTFQFFYNLETTTDATSRAVTLLSSNPAVATINMDAVVLCLARGTATITVTSVVNPSKQAGATVTCVAAAEPQPELLNVTPGTVEIDVDLNATNQHVCAFRLQSLGGAVTFTLTSDHPALAAVVSSGSIPAGGFVIVSVFYTGGVSAPFSTSVRFVATSPQGTQEVQVPVKVGSK